MGVLLVGKRPAFPNPICSSSKGSQAGHGMKIRESAGRRGGAPQPAAQPGWWVGTLPEHLTETFISFLPGGPTWALAVLGTCPLGRFCEKEGRAEDSVPLLLTSWCIALLPSCWRDVSANCLDEGRGWSQSPVSQIATWEGRTQEASPWAWDPLLTAVGLK